MKDSNDTKTVDMLEELSVLDEALARITLNHAPSLKFKPMPTPVYLPQVWYVVGEVKDPTSWPTLLRSKMDAEMYARQLFPDDSAERNYARIMYREVEGEGK